MNTKLFICGIYNCIFEADKNEYDIVFNEDSSSYAKCNCPNCNTYITEYFSKAMLG